MRTTLSQRQLEVLRLLCEGRCNKRIGTALGISSGTVKVHVGQILRRLGVESRLQAVLTAQQRGLTGDAS